MKDSGENMKTSHSSNNTADEEHDLGIRDTNKNDIDSIEEEINLDKDEVINAEVEDLEDSLKRLQADFVNYKNRADREKQQSIGLTNESLTLKILSIIDDLSRAIDSKDEKDEFSNGTELVRGSLLLSLKSFGSEGVDCSNRLDPNYHHAIITRKSDKGSDKILEVSQKGYVLNNKYIRPTMVKVSKQEFLI